MYLFKKNQMLNSLKTLFIFIDAHGLIYVVLDDLPYAIDMHTGIADYDSLVAAREDSCQKVDGQLRLARTAGARDQ